MKTINDLVVENENEYASMKKSEESGIFKKLNIDGNIIHGTFERLGTRFELVLSLSKLEKGNKIFNIIISNFYFGDTHLDRLYGVSYKLVEKSIMSWVDAESVDMALKAMETYL